MKEFKIIYEEVRGIVYKTRKSYYVKQWEVEDWDQEGMLKLYELLTAHPDLLTDKARLYVYYKVKFRNYVTDVVRKQESQKRRFDRMPYEEVSRISHRIQSPGLLNDDLVSLRSLLDTYKSGLSPEKRAQYQLLLAGKGFKGRRQMERELAEHLKDFRRN